MNILWSEPQFFPHLSERGVHVWAASLKVEVGTIARLFQTLNATEKERAAKFLVTKPRDNFIVARGILRNLLANYLQTNPLELIFKQNEHGKLYLENVPLQFNISHSHDLALFTFTYNRQIGVDVEFVRKNLEIEDIARRFFSQREVKALFALRGKLRLRAFFDCWARKEAFVKAIGMGIFYPLDKFDVCVKQKESGPLDLCIHSAIEKDQGWRLYALNPSPDYAAALVVLGETDNIHMFSYKM